MKSSVRGYVCVVALAMAAKGQELSVESMLPEMDAPIFDARISIGFNYDLLRSPTNVPFDYPRGYIGFNIPVEQSIGPLEGMFKSAIDSIFADSTLFKDGKEFQPRASARQNPNATVRVDVPMLGGVGSFSNVQNFRLSYLNTLGLPGLKTGSSEMEGVNLLLRGIVHVPLDLDMSWESMTFGYAYRVNRNLILAMNLHRHVFRMDLRAKVDIDLLGYARINQEPLDLEIPLDYRLRGSALGSYAAEAWSPTLGIKFWRLGFTSRFGINTRANGKLEVNYSLPFFVDPETFKMDLSSDQMLDPAYIERMKQNETVRDSVQTHERMVWRMPSGYTFSFDLVRDKLNISYTKFAGEIAMQLGNVWRVRQTQGLDSLGVEEEEPVDLDFGVSVDHIIMLHGDFRNAFFNLGVFALDFRWTDQKSIVGNAIKKGNPDAAKYLLLGGAPMVPILSFGSSLGTKIQLLLELDVLPLLALKTGVIYYF